MKNKCSPLIEKKSFQPKKKIRHNLITLQERSAWKKTAQVAYPPLPPKKKASSGLIKERHQTSMPPQAWNDTTLMLK